MNNSAIFSHAKKGLFMKNVLITGADGQLGTTLGKILPAAVLTAHADLDITNKRAVDDFIYKYHIDTIVNCAAYTDVDGAEKPENKDKAFEINALGAQNLAQTPCKMIHISTDYVFDGNLSAGAYTTSDMPNPLSVYGKTKSWGEIAVLGNSSNRIIIRTSWLYSPYGKNFVKTMRNLGEKLPEISVVNDQYGLPTYAEDLAVAIVQIIPQMKPETSGIYHFSNVNPLPETPYQGISWYDFATEIMKQSNKDCVVKPTTTAEYSAKMAAQNRTYAPRPKNSTLNSSKIQQKFGIQIPTWRIGLKRCLDEMQR